MQHDVGAGLLARRRRQGELAGAFRCPGEGLLGAGLAGGDLHPVGHHEGGVEADAELADQAGPVLRLGACQVLGKGAGAGAGDGAQIVDHLLPRHADAVVRDQQGAGLLVRDDADLRFRRRRQRGIGQRLEPAAINRVGGIGDQFPQEDLPLGIERVDHQIEQAADFGAK